MTGKVLKVGAAQAAPIFFDRAGTLKKTCEWIARAGERQLVDLLQRFVGA